MAHEHHIEVRRTARYYTLGDVGPETRDVWFVVHGYGQLARDFISEFEVIASPSRVIVAPEALARYYIADEKGFHSAQSKVGANWMTREDRECEISDYIVYLDALYDEIVAMVDRSAVSITVVGFSQGGATANRWVTKGNSRVDRLIMWGALIASDSDLNSAAEFFRSAELHIVYGKRDQFLTEGMIDEYRARLAEASIPYVLHTFEGGHRMDRGTLCELAERVPLAHISGDSSEGSDR